MTSEVNTSKSIFRIQAGPIHFNATFLSPIEVWVCFFHLELFSSSGAQPDNYVRQSMPFSYMYIYGIVANDSQPHTIQIYSDISARGFELFFEIM